jgi:3-hydroxyisobutyrate dehydrogenase-like beta-hydroxyacid dehydrogenase
VAVTADVTVDPLTVAVLGVGRMGGAMAGRLAACGLDVVLYNRTPDPARALAAVIGARVAATPAEAVAGSAVAISMVSDEAAVHDLFEGPTGALAGLDARTVAVDMSTVLPGTIQGLEAAVRATGAGILDAPVSGSVAFAGSGGLTIMVGGSAADVERARPVLEKLGTRVVHLGGLGAGATVKLAVNTVIYGLNESLSEALVLAEKAGVDRATVYDVISSSAAGAPFVGYKRAAFIEPDSTPTAFALALAEKDLSLILELAATVGTEMPQAKTNLELVRRAGSADPGRDIASIAAYLRDASSAGGSG